MLFKIISVSATILSCLIFLSPYTTYANLTPPADVPLLPLCSMLVQCLFWVTYGVYIMDLVVISTNIFGIACALLYTYFYARAKPKVMFYVKVIGSLVTYIGVVGFIFYNFDDGDTKTKYLGYASMGTSIVLFASPLSNIWEVVKKKDSSSIPLTLTLANLAATACWTLYGILETDINILIPNFVGVILSLVTLWVRKRFKSSGPIFEF